MESLTTATTWMATQPSCAQPTAAMEVVRLFTVLAGQVEVVRALLEANADKDAADNCGRTALRWAADIRDVRRKADVVRLLEEASVPKGPCT